MFTSTIARRTAAAVAGGALAATGLGLVGPAPAAQAAEPNAAAVALDGWISDQLTDGLLGGDVGLTIDYALGLHVNGLPAATAKAGIDAQLTSYVGAQPSAGKADEAGKAAYFYQQLGEVPVPDLVDDWVVPNVVEEGDAPTGVNAYEHVWEVLALQGAGESYAPQALGAATYLVEELRCDDGGWGFGGQSAGFCGSDPDTTALAVLALQPYADAEQSLSGEYAAALAHLKSQQAADGSFANFGTANANSTAVAGWVLGEVGETAAAQKAARWVADHQVAPVPACSSPLDAEVGAIGYKADTLEQGLEEGITDSTRFTWNYAAGQSLAVLAFLTDAPAVPAQVTGPTGYVRAGTTVTYTVSGVRPGQVACLTGFGTKQWKVGSGTAKAKLPAATGTRVLSLRLPDSTSTATVEALAPKTMVVVLARSVVARGGTQTLLARGFVPGEPVALTYRGAVVRRGVAGADGRFKTTFPVGRISGIKAVRVEGAFPVRRGTASFRVR